MNIQLDLFEELNEIQILEERDRQIHKELTNVRRGLFGRLNKIFRWMLTQDEAMDKYGKKLADIEKRLADKDQEIAQLKQTLGWMESVA